MDKRKILSIGTIMAAFLFSVVAVTVAFASYTENLTIKGSGTTKAAHWKIVFAELGSAVLGNDNGVTSTAKEVTAPNIVGDTSIETYEVELQTPGDYVTYNFKIKNSGDFPAKIDSSFAMPTPSCTKGTSGVEADATNVCSNLEYTLKYVSDNSDVKAGDTFDINEAKEVQLKIYYKKTATDEQLPTDDVAIGNLNITIPFVQY